MNLLGMHSEIKPKRRREIYEDVARLSQPGGSFYVMVALSTVIAAYGLLIDSAAVVVGAMLVAPLMGPIFGIALALASGSRRLLWPSLQSEVLGIVIAVGVGVLIGLSPYRLPIGTEWLVRTEPTLYDLVIALASGLAGAYALVDERVSPALPGVAIAVAVLPPLAACGLAIAAGEWEMAAGAIMLFTANFFAIQIAAAIVFSIFGMLRVERRRRSRPEEESGLEVMQFIKRFGISILVLVVMGWFMTNTLIGLATDRRISAAIENTLESTVSTATGARLSDTSFRRMGDELLVNATIMTPSAPDRDEVARMEDRLENVLKRSVHLIVRSLISRDMDREGAVYASDADAALAAAERLRADFLKRASRTIEEQISDLSGAELADVSRATTDGRSTITAVVRAPEAVSPERATAIEAALRAALDEPIELVIRTILIRDASPSGYLHERPSDRAATRREAILSLARTVLDSWLSANLEGATVRELGVSATEPREITAFILSPRAVSAEEAEAMEAVLRSNLAGEINLTVQYELGGRVPAAGGG